MRIHSMDPDETMLIAELWRRSWASANAYVASVEPIEHWLARVRSEFCAPCETVVAEVSGRCVAFIVFNVTETYIAQLFVEPSLKGRGLGRALLGEASRRMPRSWSLHVSTANLMAQRFYERYGLMRGEVSRNPLSGRERVAYLWQAPNYSIEGTSSSKLRLLPAAPHVER